MRQRSRTFIAAAAIAALAVVSGPSGRAQQANQPAAPTKPDILVKIDVVLSRFQGEKKTSSLPFTLLVNTPAQGVNSASLRVGIDVPVGTTTSVRTVPDNTRDTNTATTATTRNNTDYRNVGTSIDARASQMTDGRMMIGVFGGLIFSFVLSAVFCTWAFLLRNLPSAEPQHSATATPVQDRVP